ncbi:MAG: helix-hairpin-helix domain-containing protein [Anaerovoracaceae bacterium]
MRTFLNRDFIENFIRIYKKQIIKGGLIVLFIILSFTVFCIRGHEDGDKFVLDDGSSMKGAEIEVDGTEESLNNKNETDKIDENISLPNKIYVDVSGCVAKTGVYELDEGSRVYEAIDMAGGILENADVSNLNMAQILRDQDKITVSSFKEIQKNPTVQGVSNRGSVAVTNASEAVNQQSDSIININTADSSELQKITGIGPAMAEKIINYRTENGSFSRIEDLMKVSGIGEKTFAKFKDKITV